MKKVIDYFRRSDATEKFIWSVIMLIIFSVVMFTLQLKVKVKVETSIGDMIDTSYYDIKDHVDRLEPSRAMFEYIDFDTILFGDTYTLEQRIYFLDKFNHLGDKGGVDSFIKHKTNFYFIHCTATPQGRGINADWLVDFFHKPRPYGRGWARVGYSACIREDGFLDTLSSFNLDGYTSIDEFTYGVAGVNMQSLHFALVGGVDKDLKPEMNFTPAQIVRLTRLIDEILCSDPDAIIIGHRDHAGVKKSCPSFDVRELYNL